MQQLACRFLSSVSCRAKWCVLSWELEGSPASLQKVSFSSGELEAIETFLYDRRPLKQRRDLYRRLASAEVLVESVPITGDSSEVPDRR